MNNLELSVQDIKELIDTVAKNNMSGFKLQQGDFCLVIEGRQVQAVSVPAQSQAAAGEQANTAAEPTEPRGNVVKSPIVGTFYSAPGPDKPAYVTVGSAVKRGDVLFIIESMKLMNEVTSDFDGTVTEIIAQNAQGVEYGQPILVIE